MNSKPLHFLLPLLLTAPLGAQSSLLVTSRNTDEVLRFDVGTGTFEGVFANGGGLDNPVGLTFGPNGDLFVSSEQTDEVLRYDGVGGSFLGVFASGGGLVSPRQLNFGPDGHLYVASGTLAAILRYDGETGAFLDVFARGGNLSGPTSFTFGPDGDLYVVSVLTNRIKRYDGRTGAYRGNFVTQGLRGPHDLDFGPDGLLYVTNAFSNRIQRYDGSTGAFVDTFVQDPALAAPLGLSWDQRGRLYVANQGRNEVRRYSSLGKYLDSPVRPRAGGASGPLFAVFPPAPDLRVVDPVPGLADRTNHVSLEGARPGALLILAAASEDASSLLPDCVQVPGRAIPELLFPCIADESGRRTARWPVPPGAAGIRYFLRVLEPGTCRTSPVATFRFPAASSSTIAPPGPGTVR